jgi:hypothetical protein
MEGKRHSIKRAGITVMGFVLLISITVVAQEVRSEVSVQGTGFFTKDSNRFWRDSSLSFERGAVGSWIAIGAAEGGCNIVLGYH